jgi:Flp pilus assembly protein CpaB
MIGAGDQARRLQLGSAAMKQKNLAMLGVAVGCGLVAAVAVAKLSAGGNRGPETGKVLVAKKDIPLQTKLDEKDLETLLIWADMPKAFIPPDAVTDLEQVKGKSLNRTLKQGNPVSLGDLGQPKQLDLPDGCKAFTVKATQVDAVGGFVKPGARVDVMYVERTSTGKARAAIILKNMLVLAVNTINTLDEKTGAAITQVESVSLAVNEKQATRLAFADEKGKVKFLLTGVANEEAAKKLNEGEVEWVDDPFDHSKRAETVAKTATPTPAAAPKLETVVVTKKPVPQNTLVNADNLGEYFTTMDVKIAPQGVVTNPDDLKGMYVIKTLSEGQTLFKSLTDKKAVEIARTPDPKPTIGPTPHVVEEPKLPRFEQVIQEGGKTIRVIWLEVAPKKWKRFDNAKDADAYKPESAAPNPKADEPKGETLKTVAGE